ncbi:MAG TPA: two-component regulator propeller domain-containing protein, partial [Verrucomicrobiae bacterium]
MHHPAPIIPLSRRVICQFRSAWFGILFVIFLVCAERVSAAPAQAAGDAYSLRVWQAEDGLPENRVVGVVQSPDGFIWVATQSGVVRFDGVRFQRVDFYGSPGVIAGTMRVLMLDRSGRLWLAKEEGGTIFCFKDGKVQQLSAADGFPKNEAQRCLTMDGEGALWVSYTAGKVVRFKDGKVDEFTTRDGLPEGHGVSWLTTARDGTLWFAKGRQVGIFRNGRFNVLENFGSAALRIAPARAGGIWVCAGQQLVRFDQGVEKLDWGRIIPAEARDRAAFEPSVLLEDRSGAVWVGTVSSGLFRCASNQAAHVEVSNPAILSLAEDREGNLWVGTRGGGLNQVRPRMTSMINSASGLPFEAVQSVCQDESGALWIVGDNGVLARQETNAWKVQAVLDGNRAAYVTCVAADDNGAVWIGARDGKLFRWNNGEFQNLEPADRFQKRSLRCLLVSRFGGLWIGTDSSDALYRWRDGELQSFALPSRRRFIRAMAEDAAGNFWAGASDGLLVRVTDGVLTDESTKSSSISIRCLLAAANGDVWIGFAGAGVGRLRDGKVTQFTTDQGMPNDYVSQILKDEPDSLWFAGNQGIFQVRERDFDDVTAGLATRVWPVVYGRSEGMPGLQASFDYYPSSLRAADKRLYFSMLSGLAEVQLDHPRLNYRPPNVFVERVAADEKTFALYQVFTSQSSTNKNLPMELRDSADKEPQRTAPPLRELRFPPGLQQVRFEFTALSFVAPENVQFRYQLEGLDDNWVEAGNRRFASYTHPPPGRYLFKVTACNNDGIWNKVGDTLPVVFEPYVWETLWFKISATVLSAGALCGAIVFVLRRRHRLQLERLEHQRALELERTRIARDLHDDLGVGLTEIGLLGDLAGAGAVLPETNREHVQGITERARALAASLDEIVWAINPANDTPQSLVDYFFPYAQKLLGRAGIRCRLEFKEPLPEGDLNAETRHEFFHAYKEALNNIIRHSRATEVQVSLSAMNDNLLIRITDNGRGLDAIASQVSNRGLAGMRE